MNKCCNCGKRVSEFAASCPYCGADLTGGRNIRPTITKEQILAKRKLTKMIIVLVLVVIACAVTFDFGRATGMILPVYYDSMAPIMDEGDFALFRPISNSEQLQIGDIISCWTLISGIGKVLNIGSIEAIYDSGNGQLEYEVKGNGNYAPWPIPIQHEDVEGVFVGVIYNDTIGIIILLVIVLAVLILFLRYRRNKKTFAAAKHNNTDAPDNALKMGVPDSAELIQYKELLDMGAITQEEFDAKKKQLLGL